MKDVIFKVTDGRVFRNYFPLEKVKETLASGNEGSMIVEADDYKFEHKEEVTYLVLKVGCDTWLTPHDIYVYFPLDTGMNGIIYRFLMEIKAFGYDSNADILFDRLLDQEYFICYEIVDNKVVFNKIELCTDELYRDNVGVVESNLLDVVARQYKLDL